MFHGTNTLTPQGPNCQQMEKAKMVAVPSQALKIDSYLTKESKAL